MFTFRNVVAVGLFLFGSTFLWMTAAFAGRTPPPEGVVWTVVNVLALVAVIGFTAAAWGVFKGLPWWEPVALVSALVGLVAVVPYAIAIVELSGVGGFADPGVGINLAMHLGGSLVVLALVLVPSLNEWFAGSL